MGTLRTVKLRKAGGLSGCGGLVWAAYGSERRGFMSSRLNYNMYHWPQPPSKSIVPLPHRPPQHKQPASTEAHHQHASLLLLPTTASGPHTHATAMATPMMVSADEKVEMSLDDLVKLERKQQQEQKKNAAAPAAAGGAQQVQGGASKKQTKRGVARKPVLKQTQAGQTRKPGQAAKQSALQAQSKRNQAINKARGIQSAPMLGVTTAGAAGGKKKKKKASPAPKKMLIKANNVQANGGGRGGGGGGGSVKLMNGGGGGGSGKKAAGFVFGSSGGNGGGGGGGGGGGETFGPGGFKLPKGTTLKISINNTASAAAATAPVLPMAAQRKKKQQPQQPQMILNRSSGPRVNMKAAQAERQTGAGALARRMGRISVTQNTRQTLFNQSRGLPATMPQQLPVLNVGGGGKKKRAGAGGGGGGGGGGNPRQVIVRRRVN